jgi:hypothetical protein
MKFILVNRTNGSKMFFCLSHIRTLYFYPQDELSSEWGDLQCQGHEEVISLDTNFDTFTKFLIFLTNNQTVFIFKEKEDSEEDTYVSKEFAHEH